VGGGAVLGFGPIVRSQVEARAEAYGASVEVERVMPSFGGVRLRGVGVEIADVPGVRLWFSELVVGWDRRPVSVSGGKVIAVGPASELVTSLESWRAKHRGGGAGGTSGPLALEGLEVDWRDAAEVTEQHVHATGVRVAREGGRWSVDAASLKASFGRARADVEDLSVVVARDDEGGVVLERLESRGMFLRYAVPSKLDAAASGGAGAADRDPKADPAKSAAVKASPGKDQPDEPLPPKASPAKDHAATPAAVKASPASKQNGSETLDPGSEARVARAQQAHRLVRSLAERLIGWVAPDAQIGLHGVRAEIAVGEERLHLGPGRVAFRRTEGDLVLGLEPEGASSDGALTFALRVPVGAHEGVAPETRAVAAELRGGPVKLSLLGLKEGDFGLLDLHRASLESDVRVELPPDGRKLALEGRGKIKRLSLASARLAEDPIRDLDLAWRGDLTIELDHTAVSAKELEIDLGDVRLLLAGRYDRRGEGHRVDLRFEVPLLECQRAFGSIPAAMVPLLGGMRFAGTMTAKGHARFDTANLPKSYDVDWEGSLGCRVVDVPPAVDATRFKKSFEKIVYTPKVEEKTMTFGPETEGWVPLAGISRHLQSAVLTCEDGRFFRHGGFDKEAIVNSIRENLIAGGFRRGASTISMQLAKNLYLRRTKTVSRKLEEAILTLYLEQVLTKDEMMELYLNVIEFGPNIYGAGPAARHYFGTHPGRLSLSQALYLASVLPNPKVQHFGAGGAVSAGHLRYLRLLMKIVHKIGRIDDDELERALRETPIFGSPAPMVAPRDDAGLDAAAEAPRTLPDDL
jgi:hypothetical protein